MAGKTQIIPEVLLEHERRLRKAIERRQYGELAGCLADMRSIGDQHRGPEVAKRMQDVIRWARLMVTAQRQFLADELELLPLVSSYLKSGPDAPPGVCVDL